MSDKALLEDAAMAADRDMPDFIHADGTWSYTAPRTPNWNPLRSDGDALRLACKLRMTIHYETQFIGDEMIDVVEVLHSFSDDRTESRCVMLPLLDDADAATRQAIFMAAAAMAKE